MDMQNLSRRRFLRQGSFVAGALSAPNLLLGQAASPKRIQFASVGAEQGMIGMFRGHGAAQPLDQMAGFEQMAAHAAGRAGDGDVNHGGDSSLQCLK